MRRGNQAIGKKPFFGTVMLKTMQLTPLEYTHIVIYLLLYVNFKATYMATLKSRALSPLTAHLRKCNVCGIAYLRLHLPEDSFEVCPLPWKKTLVTGTCYILTKRPSRTFNLTLKTTLVKMKL